MNKLDDQYPQVSVNDPILFMTAPGAPPSPAIVHRVNQRTIDLLYCGPENIGWAYVPGVPHATSPDAERAVKNETGIWETSDIWESVQSLKKAKATKAS